MTELGQARRGRSEGIHSGSTFELAASVVFIDILIERRPRLVRAKRSGDYRRLRACAGTQGELSARDGVKPRRSFDQRRFGCLPDRDRRLGHPPYATVSHSSMSFRRPQRRFRRAERRRAVLPARIPLSYDGRCQHRNGARLDCSNRATERAGRKRRAKRSKSQCKAGTCSSA
jgi:hypothetical protein